MVLLSLRTLFVIVWQGLTCRSYSDPNRVPSGAHRIYKYGMRTGVELPCQASDDMFLTFALHLSARLTVRQSHNNKQCTRAQGHKKPPLSPVGAIQPLLVVLWAFLWDLCKEKPINVFLYYSL